MSEQKEIENLESPEAIMAIVQRAEDGDLKAMPAFRKLLDRIPEIGDALGAALGCTVAHAICTSLSNRENDLAFREIVERKMTALRQELEGPDASPLERLLIDRIVACWLMVQEADVRYTQSGNCSDARARYHLKRQESAQRRYLSAIKALATVRKLALPVIQMNIGENQVNVANAVASESIE